MLEDKLEILLITYNRAGDLERTLGQLLDSSFARCKMTVLDNASADETPSVCAKYRSLFPDLKVIRHGKNIGGLANYLRAVELSESPYTWVLCDDDHFDFTECSDVIEALEGERVDLISVGAPGQSDWERGLTTTSRELIERGARYFFVFSFLPSLIFRTALYDSECILWAYMIGRDLYPQFVFLNKSVENNFSIYTAKAKILNRGIENEEVFSVLFWFTSWVNSCAAITDQRLRRKVVYEAFESGSFVKNLVRIIYTDKIFGRKRRLLRRGFYENIVLLALGFSWGQRLQLLLALPFALIPRPFYMLAHKVHWSLKYPASRNASCDTEHPDPS